MVNLLLMCFEFLVGATALASYLRMMSLKTVMSVLIRRFMAHLFLQKMLVILSLESIIIGWNDLALQLAIASMLVQGLAIGVFSLALFGHIYGVANIEREIRRFIYGGLHRGKK